MKQKIFAYIGIVVFICVGFISTAQQFKVIGYLPYYRFSLVDEIAFEKLTHVNLAFANPSMTGDLSFAGRDVTPVISAAHAENVDVYLSLAGGALTAEWAAAWKHLMRPENRSNFIHKIMQYVELHQFDGVDMDLEWSHVDELYSGFVLELKDSLNQYNLPMTAALPGTYRYPDISATALAAFDWINMMVYDLRGPWDPDNAGPHSPVSFAYSSINYWEGQGVSKDQLTLGLPFYGYDFTDENSVRALTYNQIINLNPANANRDQDGAIYYNGIPTIVEKTELALDQLSGVMMWELGQDHFGEFSLMDKIDETIHGISTVEEFDPFASTIYPNPFHDYITIELNKGEQGQIMLTDLNGKLIQKINLQDSSKFTFETSQLLPGIYIIHVMNQDAYQTYKVVKR